MAIRFIDGFDHYATADITGKWAFFQRSGHYGITTGRFGGGALQVNNTDAGQYMARELGASYTSGVVGFAFRPTAVSQNSAFFMVASGATYQLYLIWTPDSTITFGTQSATAAPAFALTWGTWYYVELQFTTATSVAAASCKVFVNGTLYLTMATGQNTNSAGTGSMNKLVIYSGASFNGHYTLDDLYFLDIDSDTPGPLGDSRVDTILPDGAGTATDWTPLSSTNVSQVSNTTPDGDTSYVSATTNGTIDTYSMGDLHATPTTIHAVQANVWARKENTADRQVAPVFRIGGTNYTGAGQSLGTSFADVCQVFRKSPATTAAWTASEINGIEAGIDLVV